MKKFKGQIKLSLEDVELINNVVLRETITLSQGASWVQEIYKFENGNYALLELWGTDEGECLPYLTLYLKDKDDDTITDIDISDYKFNNIEQLFKSYELIKSDEEIYEITIWDEKHPLESI